MKFCVDCVHSLLIYPDNAPAFYQCSNSLYVAINPIDKTKRFLPCETLRGKRPYFEYIGPWCGGDADGFLPKVPEFKAPQVSRWHGIGEDLKYLFKYLFNFHESQTHYRLKRIWRRIAR
jgi:hypothetical protein